MSTPGGTDNNAEEEFSNVTDIIPVEGMHVELRDPDFIWSAATIVEVKKGRKKTDPTEVVLRYDGWGHEWNETLSWPNPRIARLFTYTKRVKCFLNIASGSSSCSVKKKNGDTNATSAIASVSSKEWPCKVQFRMPHPGSKHAEQLLRLEMSVYVEPFGKNLPKKVRDWFSNEEQTQNVTDNDIHILPGCWISRNRLRQWKNIASDTLAYCDVDFRDAWTIANMSREGTLPIKPFEAGTLLNEIYRVNEVGGTKINGIMYHGGFSNNHVMIINIEKEKKNDVVIDRDKDKKDKDSSSYEEESLDEEVYQPPEFEPPPSLPSPIKITETMRPYIKRFNKTTQWGASITVNGNDVFIGSFPTQTQALLVRKFAQEEYLRKTKMYKMSPDQKNNIHADAYADADIELIQNEDKARGMDVKTIDLETCISTLEKKWNPENNFSMHDWTMQCILHDDYLFEKEHGEALYEKRKIMMQTQNTKTETMKKRKSDRPRKVDCKKMCYVS